MQVYAYKVQLNIEANKQKSLKLNQVKPIKLFHPKMKPLVVPLLKKFKKKSKSN